jgi:hypothetical protein
MWLIDLSKVNGRSSTCRTWLGWSLRHAYISVVFARFSPVCSCSPSLPFATRGARFFVMVARRHFQESRSQSHFDRLLIRWFWLVLCYFLSTYLFIIRKRPNAWIIVAWRYSSVVSIVPALKLFRRSCYLPNVQASVSFGCSELVVLL